MCSFSQAFSVGLVHQAKEEEVASLHSQLSLFSHRVCIRCKIFFSTSLSNHVLWGDIVPWKTQTAKVDANVKNKPRWNWLAMEYEGETLIFRSTSHNLPMSEVGYVFDHRQTLLDHLNRESLSESKLKKARCCLKSHTVMVVKKEVCYLQVLTFGIPCSVASLHPTHPPTSPILQSWELCLPLRLAVYLSSVYQSNRVSRVRVSVRVTCVTLFHFSYNWNSRSPALQSFEKSGTGCYNRGRWGTLQVYPAFILLVSHVLQRLHASHCLNHSVVLWGFFVVVFFVKIFVSKACIHKTNILYTLQEVFFSK